MRRYPDFEEWTDSLILTACNSRLKIYKDVEEDYQFILRHPDFYLNVYHELYKIKDRAIAEVQTLLTFLYDADLIDSDEFDRLSIENVEKFNMLCREYRNRYEEDINLKFHFRNVTK